MKYKNQILLTLFAIALTFSIILAFTPTDKLCGEDQTSSCAIVQNSEYKETLGVNNSTLGIITFSFLIALTLYKIKYPSKRTEKILLITLILASLGAAHFIYLQLFVIEALCRYCMIIDTASIIALLIFIFTKESKISTGKSSTLRQNKFFYFGGISFF